MSLTIDQLFEIAAPADFVAKIKATATSVGLAPLTWLAGGITDVLISAVGKFYGLDATVTFDDTITEAPLDAIASTIAHAGFLDSAAQVTPDAGEGWLDLLGDSNYDEQRSGATKATGPVVLTNTGAARGPFAPGAYHLVNASLKKTYSNTSSFTLAAAADTTVNFAADEAGSGSNTVANVLTPVTSFVGVVVKTAAGANTNTLLGEDTQLNDSFVSQCRSKLQALGPKLGPEGAYLFFVFKRTLPGYPVLAGGAVTRAVAVLDTFHGSVNVYLANASGPLFAGDVTLLLAWLITVVKPDAVRVFVFSAVEKDVTVALTVYVPAAYAAGAAAAVQVAVQAYFSTVPIGGTVGSVLGLQRSALSAAIFEALPYVENIPLSSITFNGVAADLVLDPTQVVVAMPAPTVTVIST